MYTRLSINLKKEKKERKKQGPEDKIIAIPSKVNFIKMFEFRKSLIWWKIFHLWGGPCLLIRATQNKQVLKVKNATFNAFFCAKYVSKNAS